MNQSVYLDYCATTPVHPDVRSAMLAALDDHFGNPSSMHWAGRQAADLLKVSRQEVASGIGCQAAAGSPPDPVVHTGARMAFDPVAGVQVFFGGSSSNPFTVYGNTVECL